MARVSRRRKDRPIEYPTGDGQPAGETDIHRENTGDLIRTLNGHFADDPMMYVSGWLLIFYEEGDPRKRIAPDVFVVRGVEKRNRDHYLIWDEGKVPDLVIEMTSRQRRRQDQKKFELYRDVLKVPEIFLIDPSGGYFDAPLRGFRRSGSGYVSIEPGRGPGLPSEVLGLNLAREGYALQLELAEMRRQLAENSLKLTEAQLEQFEAENEQLRQENQALQEQANGLSD